MTIFANAAAFADPKSRLMATGVDLQARNAITDSHGNVLAYAQTGACCRPLDPKEGTRGFLYL